MLEKYKSTKLISKIKFPLRRHAAFRSKDFTKPPIYDLTTIWSRSSFGTTSGASRIGGRLSRSMCAPGVVIGHPFGQDVIKVPLTEQDELEKTLLF